MKTQFHKPVSYNVYHGEKISSKPEKYPQVSQRKYCSTLYYKELWVLKLLNNCTKFSNYVLQTQNTFKLTLLYLKKSILRLLIIHIIASNMRFYLINL